MMGRAAKRRGISITVRERGTFLLGLDAGNTVVKAVLFDAAGRQLAWHAVDGATHKPGPGMVERSVPELWENAQVAIAGCIERAGVDPRDIAAIGTAGHGNGLYLLDPEGQALIGIQSLDTRAASLAEELDARIGGKVHAISLQRPWPSQTLVLLAWVKRHLPEVYARAATVLFAKDVLTWKLTGERISEISDMSGAGVLRLPECRYDQELLELYGLGDAWRLLPPLHLPTDRIGAVTLEAARATGLAEGTPVFAGYFDVVASALGSGVARDGEASIVAGSWSINQVFSREPVRDERVFMVAAYGPGRFVNMDNSATSCANLEWYVRTLIERDGYAGDPFALVDDLVGKTTPAPNDPLFHPFLYGGRLGAHFRGGFFGLAGWHTEGHMLRAVLEGVMFEHRRHVEVLKQAGVAFSRAILSGGGSRSPHWPQIFADGLGSEISVAESRETGALGAAMGAAVGVGMYGDVEKAVAAMARLAATYRPDPAMRAHYDRRYSLWTRLNAALDPFWREFARCGAVA